MISLVEVGRRYMMTIIPVDVSHSCIICIILHDLFFAESEAIGVSVLSIGEVDKLVDVFAAKGSLAVVGRNRRSHLLEDHHVVF